MNYFIGEFLGSKIMIVANNGYYFSPLSEILRDPLWGPQDRTLCPVWPCVSTIVQKALCGILVKNGWVPNYIIK